MKDTIYRDDAVALVIKAIHGTDNKEIQNYLFGGLRKQMWSLPSAEAYTEQQVRDAFNSGYSCGKEQAEEYASAEAVQGEWIRTSNDWIDGTCGARFYPIHCSICNYSTYDDSATNFCPNCGVRLVTENEYLEPTQTHGRLIDADALSKKLCETTIFIKDGEVFQRMINDAPTVQADRPHGEWISEIDTGTWMLKCSVCGCRVQEEKYRIAVGQNATKCPYCGAELGLGGYSYDEYADRPSQGGGSE